MKPDIGKIFEAQIRALKAFIERINKKDDEIEAWNALTSVLGIWYNHPMKELLLLCYFYGAKHDYGKLPKRFTSSAPHFLKYCEHEDDYMLCINAIELGNEANFIDPSPSY